MKDDVTIRFIAYCEYIKIRQKDLIEKGLGSKQTISNIWNGGQKPTLKFLSKFLILFPTANARWLITGEGEMIDSKNKLKMVADDGNELCMKCAQKKGQIIQLKEEKEKLMDRLEKQAEEIGKLKG